jgi:hypothetical protein
LPRYRDSRPFGRVKIASALPLCRSAAITKGSSDIAAETWRRRSTRQIAGTAVRISRARLACVCPPWMWLGAREIFVHYASGMGKSKLRITAAKTGTARNMNTVAKLAEIAAKL